MEENKNIPKNENKKEKKKENNYNTSKGNFKTVSSSTYVEPKERKTRFGANVFIPFCSGVLGCILVVGVCFGVPSIRTSLLGESASNISQSPSNSTTNNGLVTQTSLADYSDTSIYAANKILPSIVGISVEYTVTSNMSMFSTQPQSSSTSAAGSGIIISDDGYILTNNHVVSSTSSESYYQISDANKVIVTLYNDTTQYEAKIVGMDKQTDLAVIKIEKVGLTKAEFADSDSVKVGEFAMAVGNPLGMQSSITCGVISAVNRDVTDTEGQTYKLIQTDAAINSGNSGGALVNSQGKVIGVNALKLSGNGVEGMGFAIPINSTVDITSQLIQYSKVKRPYIGISGIDLNDETAKAYKLVKGIYVKSVESFSAAEKSGLKIGDVIISADGKSITTMDELNSIKNTHQIGDNMTLKVNRDGQEKDITLTLGEQP